MGEVTTGQLDTWRTWIGRSEMISQYLDSTTLARFAAATGASPDVATCWPALGHWAFFQPVVANGELGSDGHPKRGGLFPPVALKRRMFASAEIELTHPLRLEAAATQISTILDVQHREGRQAELVIVQVERVIDQSGQRCIRELQSIVYRSPGAPLAAVPVRPIPEEPGDAHWQPGPVELFRFSAATANSHRIHYDQDYALHEEGYPALVVHGPFTAAMLFAHAQACQAQPLTYFKFRAQAPLFVSQPVRLRRGEAAGHFHALRCDGTLAMEARVYATQC